MIIMLSLGVLSTAVYAAEKNPIKIVENPKEIPAKVQVMLNRLDEIKAMDRSTLSPSERKELRKELRTINKEIRTSNSAIYISVGAILLIILLILIL